MVYHVMHVFFVLVMDKAGVRSIVIARSQLYRHHGRARSHIMRMPNGQFVQVAGPGTRAKARAGRNKRCQPRPFIETPLSDCRSNQALNESACRSFRTPAIDPLCYIAFCVKPPSSSSHLDHIYPRTENSSPSYLQQRDRNARSGKIAADERTRMIF